MIVFCSQLTLAAIPTGPRGSAPSALPSGPKAGRFKDKDRVDPALSEAAAAKLDYESAGSSPRKSSRSRRDRERSESDDERRERRHRSSRRSSRERRGSRERESRDSREPRDKERERSGLGPGGWDEEEHRSR